jgi:ribosomal protein L11 methyltransferase
VRPRSAGAPSVWWDLTIPASDEVSEGLTNFLWEIGALGVVEESAPGQRPRLRAFFAGTAEPDDLMARVTGYVEALGALGLPAPGIPGIAPLHDEGWAEAWREHFKPVPVGRRLVVVPPWSATASDGRQAIVIEPGRAFGTGHHGSTAGCLVAVETIVDTDRPPRAIDLGTGSGVLAIAAARLGVESTLAVDDDPDAVAAAIANAARNGVSDRVRCLHGDAGTLDTFPAPLVLANLLAAAHHRLAPRYARLVAPQGALVLGGILDGEAHAVADTVGRAGFALDHTVSLEGWTTVVLRRAEAGDATVHVRG